MFAIDVGAAPGGQFFISLTLQLSVCLWLGWTKYLAERVSSVVCIDPADMIIELHLAHKVQHLCMKAQDAAKKLQDRAQLYDILVCDANTSPSFVLEQMIEPLVLYTLVLLPYFHIVVHRVWVVEYCLQMPFMRHNAFLVLTLKNCTKRGSMKNQEWASHQDEVISEISRYCENVEVTHLMSNTTHESTLTARIK